MAAETGASTHMDDAVRIRKEDRRNEGIGQGPDRAWRCSKPDLVGRGLVPDRSRQLHVVARARFTQLAYP